MNVFFLDRSPKLCAQYHCDKHLLKQIPDVAQILCTVMRNNGISYGYTGRKNNHPCIKWAQQQDGNFLWLKSLGIELCKEYAYRYSDNNSPKHASEHIIRDSYPTDLGKSLKMTVPPQCMPDHFKNLDPVKAYRQYYLGSKADLLSYTKRHIPMWIEALGMGEHK